jgi:hypothetical protein
MIDGLEVSHTEAGEEIVYCAVSSVFLKERERERVSGKDMEAKKV